KAISFEWRCLYFEAPAGSWTARYGNTTLASPRYDLEAMRSQVRIDSVADAKWGDARTRAADENAAAASPPLPTIGSALDTSLFNFMRDVPAGAAGPVAVPPHPAV